TLADFLMIQISWVYDVNYVPSLRLIRERGILGLIGAHLPPDPDVQEVLKDAGAYLERRCREA
ncbi:MAG: HD family phosphohydrolase, partial [Lentisphaerota bacterium]